LSHQRDPVRYDPPSSATKIVVLDLDRRANELQQVLAPVTTPTEVRSPWVQAW